MAPFIIWHRANPSRTLLERPPYYGARKLSFISELVEKSINRTLNERAEMNRIFSKAVDGETIQERRCASCRPTTIPSLGWTLFPALERCNDSKALHG